MAYFATTRSRSFVTGLLGDCLQGVRDVRRLDQHILRQGDHDRAGATVSRDMESARQEFRQAGGVIDVHDPFGDRPEYGLVVELSECLAALYLRATWPTKRIIGVEFWLAT